MLHVSLLYIPSFTKCLSKEQEIVNDFRQIVMTLKQSKIGQRLHFVFVFNGQRKIFVYIVIDKQFLVSLAFTILSVILKYRPNDNL